MIIGMGVLVGCGHKNINNESVQVAAEEAPQGVVIGYKGVSSNYIPKPTAFKMSGDYSNNVAITLDANGNVIYFPAPSDITPESRPVSLGDGWWLNRQGISPSSVFTRYTFEEYSKLQTVPTIKELKAAIIPGARVTEWKNLTPNT